MNAQQLLILLYHDDPCEQDLMVFLGDADEDEIDTFLRSICPGSIESTSSLLLLWKVFRYGYQDHFRFPEIEKVLRSRIPQDPLEALCVTLR